MEKFIEVTNLDDTKILVNTLYVKSIITNTVEEGTILVADREIRVKETYEEVKDLINRTQI